MLARLLEEYPLPVDRYDELLDAQGRLRPHWEAFAAGLESLPATEMAQRSDFVRQRILENGVTYNVYADPHGADRPWLLDPLPLIIDSRAWAGIAAAVAQRARLMNALLADIYGQQTLLAEGLLPPALVLGRPDYLWPCRGVRPSHDIWLHSYAVDLARAPDGQWWVIADRTQAPSGAGYALENRFIISHAFPEAFRDMRIEPLQGFFEQARASLLGLAPAEPGEAPLGVVLTPGHHNETYFEHVYLARHLGFPLVEGRDLSVRGETLYLKTVRGLQRVHAVVRRQDDDFCDPLELRGDSALGVPGLLSVVRAGRVLMGNALGSGGLASNALMGFLPALCERLLGETLAMPSVGTWWCGEPAARDFVLANLDRLVIKSARASLNVQPAFGAELDAAQRAALAAQIEAGPQDWVAQEMVHLSQAPTWQQPGLRPQAPDGQPGGLVPRVVGLRVFALATAQGYRVMPGGLCRVASSPDTNVVTMQRGGASKDVWVVRAARSPAPAPGPQAGVLRSGDLVRAGHSLSSRVVENLFWMGRYAERLESTARMLRSLVVRWDDPVEPRQEALRTAWAVAQGQGMILGAATPPQAMAAPALLASIFDAEPPGGLAWINAQLHQAGIQVRDRLSQDHWHAIQRLHDEFAEAARLRPLLPHSLRFLDRVLSTTASLTGFALDHMTRNDAWRFLMLGRHIERLDALSGILARFLGSAGALQPEALDWLLEVFDSSITFRSRYMRAPELLPVLDLVLADEANPRSVLYPLCALERDMAPLLAEHPDWDAGALPGHCVELRRLELDRCLPDAADWPAIATTLGAIAGRLWSLQGDGRSLSEQLSLRFFSLAGAHGTHPTLAP